MSGWYYMGAAGALAPEIVRWWRIVKKGQLGEWHRADYWLATFAYCGLGVIVAWLFAKPTPDASFTLGLLADVAVSGVAARDNSPDFRHPNEELFSRDISWPDARLRLFRRHASYLLR